MKSVYLQMKNLITAKPVIVWSIWVFFLIGLSQVSIRVQLPFQKNNTIGIELTTAFLLLTMLVFGLRYYRLVAKRIIALRKWLVIIIGLLVVLGAYFTIVTYVRAHTGYSVKSSWVMLYEIAVAVTLYWFARVARIPLKSIIWAAAIFLVIVNASLFVNMLKGDDIRTSSILGNINVYIALVLLSMAPILYELRTGSTRALVARSVAGLFLLTSSLLFLVLSGSRFAIWAMLIQLIILCVYLRKYVKRSDIFILGMSVILLLCALVPVYHISTAARQNIYRAMYYPAKVVGVDSSADTDLVSTQFNTAFIHPIELGQHILNNEVVPNQPTEDRRLLTRSWIYQEAFTGFMQNPWLGSGSHLIYFEGWGEQSSHNYLVDILLTFGLIGGSIFIVIIAFPIWALLLAMAHKKIRIVSILGIASVMLFSMVEPILTDKMLIILLVWLICAGGLYDGAYRENNTVNALERTQ